MRKVVRAGVVAAVAAAVLVAVLLWPGGARSHDVLGRARAAIGDGPVLHVVVQTPSGVQFVALDGHRTVTPTDKVEMWSARNPKRGHVIARERGRVISELLSPEDDHGLGELDPAFAALWTGYQRALADGTAKLVGEDTVYGHRVYWLQFPLPADVGPGSQVAVDRRTYRAVAFHFGPKGHSIRERVLLVRTEPFSASDFRRRTAPPRRRSEPGSRSGARSGLGSRG